MVAGDERYGGINSFEGVKKRLVGYGNKKRA